MNSNTRPVLLGLLVLAFSFLLAHNSYAQDTFKNSLTFKWSVVIPNSDFGSFDNDLSEPDSNGVIPFQHKTAYHGFGFQFGKMYFLGSLNKNESLKWGLDVTWIGISLQTVGYNVKYNTNTETTCGEYGMIFLSVSPELGPSLSYSFTESIAIDISFKISPTIGTVIHSGVPTIRGDASQGLGLRYTPAFYFRLKKLIVGAEYSTGEIEYLSGGEIPGGTSPYTSFRVVVGAKF